MTFPDVMSNSPAAVAWDISTSVPDVTSTDVTHRSDANGSIVFPFVCDAMEKLVLFLFLSYAKVYSFAPQPARSAISTKEINITLKALPTLFIHFTPVQISSVK